MKTPKQIFFESYEKQNKKRRVTKMVVAIKNYHGEPEIIITTGSDTIASKMKYNADAYDDNMRLKLKNDVQIVNWMFV